MTRLKGTCAALAALVVLCGFSAAVATAESAPEKGDLTVDISLSSSGKDPARATIGDTITSTSSVTNNTTHFSVVTISRSFTGPNDNTFTRSRTVILAAGRTYSVTWSFKVGPLMPLGTYTRTATAENVAGSESSDTTSIEIY